MLVAKNIVIWIAGRVCRPSVDEKVCMLRYMHALIRCRAVSTALHHGLSWRYTLQEAKDPTKPCNGPGAELADEEKSRHEPSARKHCKGVLQSLPRCEDKDTKRQTGGCDDRWPCAVTFITTDCQLSSLQQIVTTGASMP